MLPALLSFGIPALLFVVIVAWARSRLIERAEQGFVALERLGARATNRHPPRGLRGSARIEFELGGRAGVFDVAQYSRDYILQTLRIPATATVPMNIRREGSFERFAKALHLGKDIQTGDATFDAAAYVKSKAPEENVRRVLENPALKAAILRLHQAGYALDVTDGWVGAMQLRGFYASFESPELPGVLALLGEIAEAFGAEATRFGMR